MAIKLHNLNIPTHQHDPESFRYGSFFHLSRDCGIAGLRDCGIVHVALAARGEKKGSKMGLALSSNC